VSTLLPWLQPAWRQLQESRRKGQLAHAILLRGRAGFGKSQLVSALVASLLCDNPATPGEACGTCRGCALLAAGSHPDLLRLVPAEPGKSILIDQVRELGGYFALRPHYGTTKIAVLEPADALNRAAANALLKILEEPPAGALIVLTAARAERLPATVRSRCQQHVIDRGSVHNILTWLDQQGGHPAGNAEALARAGGSPLRALEFVDPTLASAIDRLPDALAGVAAGTLHPLSAAAQCSKMPVLLLIDQILRLCHELFLLKNWLPLPLAEAGRTVSADLQRMANELDSRRIAEFVQRALDVKQLKLSSASARDLDLAESVWFDWRATGQ